ncbi:MAG: hypothetical protein AAF108_03340 [Planctomycetota bacterium]
MPRFQNARLRKAALGSTVALAVLTLVGCASYSKITDGVTGDTYYVQDKTVEPQAGGEIRFTDGATGNTVTLTDYERTAISGATFNNATKP